ncbi:MAG: prepilin-type N-terminal cleavage/methylation domain-containing protein [Candidatus Methylacidiphilales bacterium]|nr:prepilin-type N-terminal cleavage/methylation domain-containing protein [Candidatus Methylacidiphilales bacterium]
MTSTHQKKTLCSAFTLIELLVVVVIIGLLAALGIPSINSALNRARTAEDINKLKQIGLAMSAFSSENGGRLPNDDIRLPPPVPQTEAYVWAESVDRYFPPIASYWNRTSYNWVNRPNSPFFSRACDPYPGFSPGSQYKLWTRPIAFSYNKYTNDPQWDGYINRIPNPSKTVVVAEINGLNTLPMSPDQAPSTSSKVQASYRVSRPGNKALYLFADYHVEELVGDRGLNYYNSRPNETNIWKWW